MERFKNPRKAKRLGPVDRFLAHHLEGLLKLPGSRLYRQFERATHDVRATQEGVLGEIVAHLAWTPSGSCPWAKGSSSATWV